MLPERCIFGNANEVKMALVIAIIGRQLLYVVGNNCRIKGI